MEVNGPIHIPAVPTGFETGWLYRRSGHGNKRKSQAVIEFRSSGS